MTREVNIADLLAHRTGLADTDHFFCDFTRAERVNRSFIPADLRKQESDLIVSVPWRGLAARKVWVYMLESSSSWVVAPVVTVTPSTLSVLLAGASWAVYSVLGRGVKDPVGATAGNFLRSMPFAAVLSLATVGDARIDAAGAGYAVL